LSDLPPALLDRVRLLVSELVTNAVVHGPRTEDSAVQLTVHTSPKSLTVEVRDTGSGFQRRLLAPSVRGSGWGLFLVEKMSDRWGVNGNDQTRVWFQIDRRAPSVA
jgi:anti-sigma regulatory factor (Ser/Thr protein kinase)